MEIVEKAISLVQEEKLQEAQLLASLVVRRISEPPSSEDALPLAKALDCLGFVNMYLYHDFSQAYNLYLRSLQIAKTQCPSFTESPLLNLGYISNVIGDKDRCIDYTYSTFKKSKEFHTHTWMNVAYSNLLECLFLYDAIDIHIEKIKEYSAENIPEEIILTDFCLLLQKGALEFHERKYADALNTILQAHSHNQLSSMPERAEISLLLIEGLILQKNKSYQEAKNKFMKVYSMSTKYGYPDNALLGMKLLSELALLQNDSASWKEYKVRHAILQDSITNAHVVRQIAGSERQIEINSLTNEMEGFRHRHKILVVILAILLPSLICISALGFILFRKNRSLKEKNQLLYKRIQESLHSEQNPPLPSTEHPEEETAKYASSRLMEDKKREIEEKILHIMGHSDSIYQQEFTLENLAEECGEHSRYVSQVINESMGKNFNALLNEYRIKEACRRLSNPEITKNLTLEGIATQLGFKSRSGFSRTFKKETGLSPSDYLKMASQNP